MSQTKELNHMTDSKITQSGALQRLMLPLDSYTRANDEDDAVFYSRDRMVNHLDETALGVVEEIVETLTVEEAPAFLDLMAGIDSHIPPSIHPGRVVGLGLNERELAANPRLDERLVRDLNADPSLPFDDGSFDIVLNTVSVQYAVRPFELFAEVGRVLRPGGLFVVLFSDRSFPDKEVKIWLDSSDEERVWLVEDYFRLAGCFERPRIDVVRGLPRPDDDKWSYMGIPSDPIYAVHAERLGGAAGRPARPGIEIAAARPVEAADLEINMKQVRETLACPYCGEKLDRLDIEPSPFLEWDNEYVYLCANNSCPYLLRSWATMQAQGNPGFSSRLMYDPLRNKCTAAPVPPKQGYRETLVADRG